MTDIAQGAAVTITLKDVYQGQQALERTLGDAINGLNLTMERISAHLAQVDQRNQAADQLHKEQGERIRKLEDQQLSQATLEIYRAQLLSSKRAAIGAAGAAVAAVATAAGLVLAQIH